MKKLKKVLIVELYDHPKVLENTYHLINSRCSLTYFMNKDKQSSYQKLFPSANNANVIINKFHSSTMFFLLLFYGRKYDYINISTGPEGGHFSELFNVIFFYFCCLIYKKKIILTIKNIRPYLSSTGGLFSFFRSKAIRYIRRFTFESKSMKKTFEKYSDVEFPLLGVSYDRYSDLLDKKLQNKINYNYNKEEIKIGILGVIDETRRDYSSIIKVLKNTNFDKNYSITFVTLGACYGGNNNEVIKAIAEYTKIDCIKGIISDKEFDYRGTACDLLISPLLPMHEYGTFKGSGSFGDAVYLRKRIILPKFVDMKREFKDIAIYYNDIDDLQKIFNNLNNFLKISPSSEFIEKFNTNKVYNNLIKDLKLC
jgi:hypothetical protein